MLIKEFLIEGVARQPDCMPLLHYKLPSANSFLGASALPSVKKAASGLDPPPTILATGQNNNRKKLQLQFSFQEKSVSDDEENDDEIGSFAFVSQDHMKTSRRVLGLQV